MKLNEGNPYSTDKQKMERLANAMNDLADALDGHGFAGDTIEVWVSSAFKGIVDG